MPKRLIGACMGLIAGSLLLPVSPAVGADEDCHVDGFGKLTCEVDNSGGGGNGSSGTPKPPNQCGPWEPVIYGDPRVSDLIDITGSTRTLPDGTVQTLYFRTCPAGNQVVWWSDYTAEQVARWAYNDLRSGRLPAPLPQFAPPAEAMIVNFETWFGATPTIALTVRAEAPGVWAEATAVPVSIELDTHGIVSGDTTKVACTVWGSTTAAANGCTWTPLYPSVQAVTGTSDYRYHATITIVWDITWRASTGERGTFNDLRTTTATNIAVREIQTIGGKIGSDD